MTDDARPRRFYGIAWVPPDQRIYHARDGHQLATVRALEWFRVEGRRLDPQCGFADCVAVAHQRPSRLAP